MEDMVGQPVQMTELKIGGTHAEEMASLNAAAQALEAQQVQQAEPKTGTESVPSEPVKAEPVAQPPVEAAKVEPKPEPVAIPEKFAKPDGTVNQEALEKSTFDAAQALEKYRALERELKQKINAVNQAKRGFQLPNDIATQPQAQPQHPPTFEEAVEASVKTKGLGATLAELTRIAAEDARQKALAEVQELREEAAWNRRERDLNSALSKRPEFARAEKIEELAKRIEASPFLQNAPNPWLAAMKDYLGDQALNSTVQSQVMNPNPKGPTAQPAPVGPVTVPQVPTAPKLTPDNVRQVVKDMGMDDIRKLIEAHGGVTFGH